MIYRTNSNMIIPGKASSMLREVTKLHDSIKCFSEDSISWPNPRQSFKSHLSFDFFFQYRRPKSSIAYAEGTETEYTWTWLQQITFYMGLPVQI